MLVGYYTVFKGSLSVIPRDYMVNGVYLIPDAVKIRVTSYCI